MRNVMKQRCSLHASHYGKRLVLWELLVKWRKQLHEVIERWTRNQSLQGLSAR